MNKRHIQRGFTLIEVLIVIIIMAVLAATIIPQFSTSTKDAKINTMKFNLKSLRAQIGVYKYDHDGLLPAFVGNDLPGLWNSTDAAGTLGTGALFPHGPYMDQMAVNPLSNSNFVTASAVWPPAAATADGGWFYDPATGKIAPNDVGYLTE